MSLQDKVALVTGGGRGIGRAICLVFAQKGADVIVADLDMGTAREVAAEVEALGRRALALAMNVADEAGVDQAAAQAQAWQGRIDIWVNNAGVGSRAMLHEMTAEQWDKVLTVNLRGAFLGTRAAARIMMPQNSGRIINMSSRAGKGGSYGHCSYGSSKAGMVGLTKSTARELGKYNITANAIQPGFIATDLTKNLDKSITTPEQRVLPRAGRPEDVAYAAAYLASDEAEWVTGITLEVTGGTGMFAGLREIEVMRFDGRCAVVTGGGGGFGKAFGAALAAEGCNVVLADVNQEALANNEAEINQAGGGKALAVLCDVTNGEAVKAMAAQAVESFGSLDILINNAGGSMGVPRDTIDQVKEEDWDKVVSLNLKGTFLCTKAAAGYMKKAGYGKIVNLSSITARMGGQLTPVQYVSAKGAIISFTRHVAQELGPFGINVNAVAPGIVLTGERLEKMWYGRKSETERQSYVSQVPLRRLGSPQEIAEAVLYLCSDQAGIITGVTLDVNGGMFSA